MRPNLRVPGDQSPLRNTPSPGITDGDDQYEDLEEVDIDASDEVIAAGNHSTFARKKAVLPKRKSLAYADVESKLAYADVESKSPLKKNPSQEIIVTDTDSGLLTDLVKQRLSGMRLRAKYVICIKLV